jgi:segregation and condensation protein B
MKYNPEVLVEASLFSAGRPLTIKELAEALNMSAADVKSNIQKLKKQYSKRDNALEIARVGDKYIIQVKSDLADYVKSLAPMQIPMKVLKTAALIAYHQPIKQSELQEMHGAKIYDHVSVLYDLGLVRKRQDGRTVVLTTTPQFSEYFGIDTTDREKIKKWLTAKLKGFTE